MKREPVLPHQDFCSAKLAIQAMTYSERCGIWGSHSGSYIFQDISPYSPLKVNRHFGRTCRLHLQGRMSRARYRRERQASILLRPWRWRWYIPSKHQWTLTDYTAFIPVDSTLHNHRCENLKSYIISYISHIVQYKQESTCMIIHTMEPDKECSWIVPTPSPLPSSAPSTISPALPLQWLDYCLYNVRRWAPADRLEWQSGGRSPPLLATIIPVRENS
jgi:hypothetical protein